jgi:two-component system sensor histidine kinase KdpD
MFSLGFVVFALGVRGAHVMANPRRLVGGALAAAAAVGAVTGVVYLLRSHVPALSLGVLYVLAVSAVALFFGRVLAIAVSLASVLLFNFLFLPPTLELTLSGRENWLVFTVYLSTGLLVSDLASRARRRAREAEQREREAALLAELSTTLLSGAEVAGELPQISGAAAGVLEVPVLRIELGDEPRPASGEVAIALSARDTRVGTLYVAAGAEPNPATRGRFLPALASLLAVAVDHERLAREALEAEALRRSDAVKTALIRSVSHDLRSPLTAIRAALEGLRSADLVLDDIARKRLLETALSETLGLDRLVRNLLDLSRLQAGAARAAPDLRTIEGLLDQALVHSGGGPRVEISLAAGTPLVYVDPTQVEHALVNLLENALKFSTADTKVSIDVESTEGEVIVRISDRGPGLPAFELDRVFEPFTHASTASGRKGAGLGLAIAKGFVEANGGRIWAESEAGGGAVFVLTLPAAVEPTRTVARADVRAAP